MHLCKCTSNTIQPVLKKVKTQPKKEERNKCYKWSKVLKRSLSRGRRAEAMKRNQRSWWCTASPSALCFLCFTLLQATLLYHIFTGCNQAPLTHSSFYFPLHNVPSESTDPCCSFISLLESELVYATKFLLCVLHPPHLLHVASKSLQRPWRLSAFFSNVFWPWT